MPRIRYLKPDFFKDEDIAELPHQVRLFFAGLWNYADREGRLEERPKRLKVEIFPYESADIDKMLQQLAEPKTTSQKPFILRYQVNGSNYIQILAWHKHQKPHHTEQESIIPPAPPLILNKDNYNGKCQDGLTPLSNGVHTVKDTLIDIRKAFADIYAKYPKKVGRKLAFRHFMATVKSKSDIERVCQALNNYLASARVAKGYVQNASTWFNDWETWVDYTEPICLKCKGKGKYVNDRGYEVVCDCQPKGKENPRL